MGLNPADRHIVSDDYMHPPRTSLVGAVLSIGVRR